MPEDDLSRAARSSTPPSFDFDDEAIASLLDSFVETQTGPQSKHTSRPPDPDDAGAGVAQRSVFRESLHHDALPLVGRSGDAAERRVVLLETLADRALGSAKARLLTAAAELREQRGDPAGARLRYQEALDADARDVVALRAIRRLAMREGDWHAVATTLERESGLSLAVAERAAALRMRATILLQRLHDPASAEQAARRAAELEDDFVAPILIASACLARNEPRRAAQALIAAADRWPEAGAQARILLDAAEIFERAGALRDAAATWERVLTLDSTSLQARLGLVRAARASGDLSQAVAELEAGAAYTPGPLAAAFRRTAAVSSHLAGAGDHAWSLLERSQDAASVWTRAEIAALHADLPGAIEALETDPSDESTELGLWRRARLARLRAESRDPDALVDVEILSERVPALTPYLAALAELREDAGENPARPGPKLQMAAAAAQSPVAAAARADEAARNGDLPRLCSHLGRELQEATDSLWPGAALALAEASASSSPADRVDFLLDLEAQRPFDVLVNRALILTGADARRDADRWMAEAGGTHGLQSAFARVMAYRAMTPAHPSWDDCESALRGHEGYPPASWALEWQSDSRELRAEGAVAQAHFDPDDRERHFLRASIWSTSRDRAAAHARAALDPDDPDPLLIEHLCDLLGPASEQAADSFRRLSSRREDSTHWRRAAALCRAAGRTREAASLLRRAELDAPDDPGTRVRRKEAELEAGELTRLADAAVERAKAARDEREELAALSEMAEIDRFARLDMQSARLALQSIAELRPAHVPTARALEWDALRERDPERIRAAARMLAEALDPGTADRIARYRLIAELRKTDPDSSPADRDHALRGIDDSLAADPGLARQVLGAAYAKGDAARCAKTLRAVAAPLTEPIERDALALEEARARRAAGDTEGAFEAIRDAHQHPLAVEEEARLRHAAAQWDSAASLYRRAAEQARSPRRAASLWREAALLFEERLGDEAQATRAWEAAAACDITYLDVYRRLAAQYREQGRLDALGSLTESRIEAGGDTPTLVGLLLERATQRRNEGDLEGVMEALHRCLELDPHHLPALEKRVEAHRATSDWQGAAETLIRIARLARSAEEQAWAFSQLGEIYHEHLGDLERAEASLRRARALCPAHIETLDRLSSVLALEGKAAESAAILQELVRRSEDATQKRDYRIRLAAAVEQAGQPKQAERILEALRADEPIEPDVILSIADFYDRQGDGPAEAMHLNRALNELRAAIETNPENESLWTTLVRVLDRRHGPGPASCAASAAIAIGHPPSLFEGNVTATGQALGEPTLPLPRQIDATVAPPGLPATLVRLFTLCEHPFDKFLPFDAAAWRLRRPGNEHRPLVEEAGMVAEALGISEPRLKVTYVAPMACIPVSGDPPTLVVGGHLHEAADGAERAFLFARALKVASIHLAPALRARPDELDLALLALLQEHGEARPESGRHRARLEDLRKKLLKAVPRRWRDEVDSLVLELRGDPAFSTQAAGFAISTLGDRVALTLTGDVPSAVAALVKIAGRSLPPHGTERIRAIRETPESWDLVRFAISNAHFEARAQAGVDL